MNMRVMKIELTRLRNLVPEIDWQADIEAVRFVASAVTMNVIEHDQVDKLVRLVGEKYRNTITRFASICNQAANKIIDDRLHAVRGAVTGKIIGKNVIVRPPAVDGDLWLTRCRSCAIEVKITGDMMRTGKNDGACKC